MTRRHTTFWREDTNLRYERRININPPPPGAQSYSIDPRQEIELRTLTCLFDRTGCVVSMADGFQSAGMMVEMHTNVCGIRKRYFHMQRYSSVPIYWFLGYALAQNRWGHIKRLLGKLPHTVDKFRIYEDSAHEYMGSRRGQPADLIAPLGLIASFLK